MLPPSWKSEVQKAVEEAANRNTAKREASEADESATITDQLSALVRQFKGQEARESGPKKIKKWTDFITLALVALTAIFTGLAWWVFRGQLHVFKDQLGEMQKVYGPVNEAAEAAKRAADAATKQAENAEKTLVQSQRAWVGPGNAKIVDGVIEIGKPLNIAVDFLNTGREPAVNFVYTGDIFVGSETEETNGINYAKIDAYFKGCREANLVRGGQVVFPSVAVFGGTGQTFSLTQPDSFVDQDIIDGTKTIYVDGCFLYKSFATVRHSYFCFFYKSKYSKPTTLNICKNGNGAD